ncbi:MAG: asparaginase [Rubrivivax sp.]
MASAGGCTVILGTGGTIAGEADAPGEALRYTAARRAVSALVQAVPALAGLELQAEQVAQVDSKDMGPAVWTALAQAVERHLRRAEVSGVVITHGTDTLEETAILLHRLLGPAKPVVLTAAMRPATSLQADGPGNLADAVSVARTPRAQGVMVCVAGGVFHPEAVRKHHTWRLDAFAAGDEGLLGHVVDGRLQRHREWPAAGGAAPIRLPAPGEPWPRVEIVTNHAGCDGRVVDLLCADGLEGLVLAGTGNGTLSEALEGASRRAQARGVMVWRASRCAAGGVVGGQAGAFPSAGALSPGQARVALTLALLGQHRGTVG